MFTLCWVNTSISKMCNQTVLISPTTVVVIDIERNYVVFFMNLRKNTINIHLLYLYFNTPRFFAIIEPIQNHYKLYYFFCVYFYINKHFFFFFYIDIVFQSTILCCTWVVFFLSSAFGWYALRDKRIWYYTKLYRAPKKPSGHV